MASLRDIRTRIGSVENTQQVTRAMKMVAAAKLRRAQERIFQTRPYAFELAELISHLKSKLEPGAHQLFAPRESVRGALVIVVTADRGLAGAFNSNVIKLTEQVVHGEFDPPHSGEVDFAALNDAGNLHLLCVGRKGHQHFARRGYELEGDFRGVYDDLSFETAREIAGIAADGYLDERWDRVTLVYNEFKNTISQNRIVEPLLPVPPERFLTPVMREDIEEAARPDAEGKGQKVDYIFEPEPKEILKALVPRYLSYQIFRVLLESNAAEQGARMIAMDSATNNAGDLLDELRLQYNRARQSAITTEIIEITSGAEALANAE